MADRATLFALITIFVVVTVLFIFGMKYLSAARQARLRFTSEDTYRELADNAVKAHRESAEALSSLQASVSAIETRLASVEKLLKDVG